MSRESMGLRGQVFEQDQSVKLGPDGMPVEYVVRGFTPQGDSAESFTVAKGEAKWKSPVDAGSTVYNSPAFYVAQGGTISGSGLLLEALLAAPGKSLALLPGGRAHAEKLVDATVTDGKTTQTVTAWTITGLSPPLSGLGDRARQVLRCRRRVRASAGGI